MKLSIIGTGTIGKATGIGLHRYVDEVIFYDIDERALKNLSEKGYKVTDSLVATREFDIHMVCVPTHIMSNNTYDLTFLESAVKEVAGILTRRDSYQVVVIRSTVLPYTIRTRVMPLLEAYCQLKLGEEYGICYNPEFLREAHALEDFLHPPVIIIGESDKKSGDMLAELYAPFASPQIRTSIEDAEAIKCFSNVYNAVKVSFFNEVYLVAQRCGLDHETITQAMIKSSLGIRIPSYYTKGGYPFGGKCLPKDLAAFTSFVKEQGLNSRFFEVVAEINEEMKNLETSARKSLEK